MQWFLKESLSETVPEHLAEQFFLNWSNYAKIHRASSLCSLADGLLLVDCATAYLTHRAALLHPEPRRGDEVRIAMTFDPARSLRAPLSTRFRHQARSLVDYAKLM